MRAVLYGTIYLLFDRQASGEDTDAPEDLAGERRQAIMTHEDLYA